MSALVKVDFYGDSIWAGKSDEAGDVLVAVKPICESLGVEWEAQRQRIRRDEVLNEGASVMQVPSPGGAQETLCLPMALIPGFLFGISSERIADPQVRQKVLVYRRECYRVLYEHFFGRPEAINPTADWDWDDIERKGRMVDRARLTLGRKAAEALWRELGLPVPDPARDGAMPQGGALQGIDFVRQFLAERTDEAPGGRVQARELSLAYAAWAAKANTPSMTERAIAMCLDAIGIRKSKQSVVYYLGIRIKHLSEITG